MLLTFKPFGHSAATDEGELHYFWTLRQQLELKTCACADLLSVLRLPYCLTTRVKCVFFRALLSMAISQSTPVTFVLQSEYNLNGGLTRS